MTKEEILEQYKGEQLRWYIKSAPEYKDLAEMEGLLDYALVFNREEEYKMLERIIREDLELVAVYPGLGKDAPLEMRKATPDMKFIGDIYDGGLYLRKKKKSK